MEVSEKTCLIGANTWPDISSAAGTVIRTSRALLRMTHKGMVGKLVTTLLHDVKTKLTFQKEKLNLKLENDWKNLKLLWSKRKREGEGEGEGDR